MEKTSNYMLGTRESEEELFDLIGEDLQWMMWEQAKKEEKIQVLTLA